MKTSKYISRIESYRTIGWWVRICVTGSKPTISKFFSDQKIGSTEKAFRKAVRYRNRLLKDLGLSHRLNRRYRTSSPQQHNSINTSGIIGLRRETTYKGVNEYYSWRAHYNENGQQKIKSFSVHKYGECEAFRKACRVRYEKSGILYVNKRTRFPCRLPANIYKVVAK